ncbi:MAG: hypothetical protein LUF04_11185 [Bacteroides sp.]|nr:hypothetical protein [Bacteroides sp.]
MKNGALYDTFIKAIKDKIPENSKLVNMLMDLLYIEKEAVYRRLRCEVPFTFSEIATISNHLGISIDCIVGTSFNHARPFQYNPLEYDRPDDIDLSHIEHFAEQLHALREGACSELADCSNVLPQTIYLAYEHLTKFSIFKWKYQRGGLEGTKKYAQIVVPDKVRQVGQKLVRNSHYVENTYYVFDNLMFQYLVSNIRYFASIDMITPEEIGLIREDLHSLLDELELLAIRGKYEDTGKQVLLYISNINFETSYCYFQSSDVYLSMVKAFSLNSLNSMDKRTFETMKSWILSLKRLSTMISVSGEMQRIIYFRKQREIIDSL